jgi:hypothetical protein
LCQCARRDALAQDQQPCGNKSQKVVFHVNDNPVPAAG